MSEYRLSDYQRPRLNILRNSSRNGLVIPLGQYQNIEGLKDEICEKLGKNHKKMIKILFSANRNARCSTFIQSTWL